MSGAQIWRSAARALRSAGSAPTSLPSCKQSVRKMAGDHGHHGVKFEGLTLHEPASWHSNVATGMTGLMWFWVFLRWSKDGETLLFGHAPHFEHDHDHGHEDGGGSSLLYKPGKQH